VSNPDIPPFDFRVRKAALPDPAELHPAAGPVRAPEPPPSSQSQFPLPPFPGVGTAAERAYLVAVIAEQERQITFWRDQCAIWIGLCAKAERGRQAAIHG